MSAYADKRAGGRWRYRTQIRLPDGSRVQIYGTPNINEEDAAKRAEKDHIKRAEDACREAMRNPTTAPPPKEVITFKKFVPTFLEISETKNKPSQVESKESILRVHLTPAFGELRLDRIGDTEIQDYVVAKKKLSAKTINNHLTVLRRLLFIARKRKLIDLVPEIEWLKTDEPDFDFLDYGEAQRLIAAAETEWRPMIVVGLKAGLRLGELLALRWEDVDLVKGQIRVKRSVTRGIVTTPKSRKSREVPLGVEAIAALKDARHLKGELVFSNADGRMLTKGETRHPLRRAYRRAGLRQIGWHVLRHSYASHLTMRGAPLKVVQELLGHSTIRMTEKYAHLSPNVKTDAVKLLDGLHGVSVVRASN
jgi:integrase